MYFSLGINLKTCVCQVNGLQLNHIPTPILISDLGIEFHGWPLAYSGARAVLALVIFAHSLWSSRLPTRGNRSTCQYLFLFNTR